MDKIMKTIGGKRGLAVVAAAGISIATEMKWITPDLALRLSEVAAALGLVGVGHNYMRGNATTEPTEGA